MSSPIPTYTLDEFTSRGIHDLINQICKDHKDHSTKITVRVGTAYTEDTVKKVVHDLIGMMCSGVVERLVVRLKLYKIENRNNRKEIRRQLKRCWGCNVLNPDCKSCMKCQCACYCNAECQRADWAIHKQICSKLVNIKDIGATDRRVLLSVRHAVSEANFSQFECRTWTITFDFKPKHAQAVVSENIPLHEASLRETFPWLPTGVHIFKIGGEIQGYHAFIINRQLYIMK
jgi:hypothetical protein